MEQLIDWHLSSKNQILINKKDVNCVHLAGIIYITDENGVQTIDPKNLIYTKKNDEYLMTIDFNQKTCEITLPTNETVSMKIECQFNYNKNIIKMRYTIEEELQIVVNLKKMEEQ